MVGIDRCSPDNAHDRFSLAAVLFRGTRPLDRRPSGEPPAASTGRCLGTHQRLVHPPSATTASARLWCAQRAHPRLSPPPRATTAQASRRRSRCKHPPLVRQPDAPTASAPRLPFAVGASTALASTRGLHGSRIGVACPRCQQRQLRRTPSRRRLGHRRGSGRPRASTALATTPTPSWPQHLRRTPARGRCWLGLIARTTTAWARPASTAAASIPGPPPLRHHLRDRPWPQRLRPQRFRHAPLRHRLRVHPMLDGSRLIRALGRHSIHGLGLHPIAPTARGIAVKRTPPPAPTARSTNPRGRTKATHSPGAQTVQRRPFVQCGDVRTQLAGGRAQQRPSRRTGTPPADPPGQAEGTWTEGRWGRLPAKASGR